MSNWHNMDVYPPPEEKVLLLDEDGSVAVGYWIAETGQFMRQVDEDDEEECEPIAWRAIADGENGTHN